MRNQATESAERFRGASGISGKCTALFGASVLVVLIDDAISAELMFRECAGMGLLDFITYKLRIEIIL
jgi:hypothetical protein